MSDLKISSSDYVNLKTPYLLGAPLLKAEKEQESFYPVHYRKVFPFDTDQPEIVYKSEFPDIKQRNTSGGDCNKWGDIWEPSSRLVSPPRSFPHQGFVGSILGSAQSIQWSVSMLPHFRGNPITPLKEDLDQEKQPWELSRAEVVVHENYDAQIVGDEGEDYLIEFIDDDYSMVEANLPKERFRDLPHPVKVGTHFWIVVYSIHTKQEIRVSVWPVAKHWHPSWIQNS